MKTRKLTTRLTVNEFIRRSRKNHNSKYNYSKTIYVNAQTKVIIICPLHGSFMQRANDHMRGSGCSTCRDEDHINRRRKTNDEFLDRAQEIHGKKYDYSKTVYKHNKQNIVIICSRHGEFSQTPSNHLQGQNCPRCRKSMSSKIENKWLDKLNITDLKRQKKIILENGKYYIADGYDPISNTVYEFWGDFWHGNLDIYNATDLNKKLNQTFGQLHEKTINKIETYKENGYYVKHIWENDFLNGDKSE